MTQTLPDLSGFETHFGIRVSYIGEDGYMVALGHHDDKRRVVAAMNRLARKQAGLVNMLDDSRGGYADVADWLFDDWGIELTGSTDEWCIQWGAQGNPDAFPITIWKP
jgi:hypothetical protein